MAERGEGIILTAHQPQMYGWLGLYDKIRSADTFCIFDDVQFTPKDFISRNRIRTKDGWAWLTVPTLNKGHRDKTIREIEIAPGNWARKHYKTIEQNYSKAPYWDRYQPWLHNLYSAPHASLAGFNRIILDKVLKELRIKTRVVTASDYDFSGEKSDLVLDMCKTLGADEYIFGINGLDYADIGSFNRAGVEVTFQNYEHPKYNQHQGDWEPYMCVLDLLMNHGPDAKDIL